jgi:hypothetical protein
VKLVKLELDDFRGIRSAVLSFAAGLNVLHGPNELGKSTLVEAIRAGLLVPTKSKEGKSYVRWDTSGPARVTLTFESGGKLWRVRKTFGSGYQSVLEQSENVDPPRYREVARGGDVEGTLRELLGWGIAPPGGKGASAKATSYLVTALLGRQGEVQSIFEASLADDKDDAGKTLVTKALGVLGKDPLVARIVERLSERVDTIFTPGEKFKKSADSPLVRLQEQLKAQEERLCDLKDADSRGRAIEDRVVTLQTERLQLLAEKQSAQAAWTTAKRREERAVRRASLQTVLDDCARELNLGDRLASESISLQATLANEVAQSTHLHGEADLAASRLKTIQQQLQTASEEVVRASEAEAQSARVADAAFQQRRAELQRRRAVAEIRLKDVVSAERAVAEKSALERDLRDAVAAAQTLSDTVVKAQQVLDHATLNSRLRDLTERQATADRAAAEYDDARRRQDEASDRVKAAETELADAVARRDDRDLESNAPEAKQVVAEVNLLRAVELRTKIQATRAEVQDLERHDTRARECRDRAFTSRSKASQLEQEVSSRVLPTREQITAWRALESDVGRSQPVPDAPARPSAAAAVAAGLGAGLLVTLAVRFGIPSGLIRRRSLLQPPPRRSRPRTPRPRDASHQKG